MKKVWKIGENFVKKREPLDLEQNWNRLQVGHTVIHEMVYYLLYQKATVCPQTAKKRSWWKFHQFLTTKAIWRSLRRGESSLRYTR